uniref:Uncharacterized protein n=1 Tax=Aegilops tauschii subsp. strangulata TaxID=200361 RepID=A0A453APU2_AEGTS
AEEAKLFKYPFPYLYDESLKKLLRVFEQSAHQSSTCSKRMGEGHLNFFTMGNLMIQDPVTMCQSPEEI